MRTEECEIAAGGERLAATKVYAASNRPPSVISLHGLGVKTTRNRIRYLLDFLAGHGLSSVCFDFSGNGESTGTMERSCLRRQGGQEQPTLIGTSMGADLAASLTPVLRPRNLILFSPAAYPEEAADLKFDEDFVRPGPYANSPAFKAMDGFTGNLLVVSGRQDVVVPKEVVDRYLESACRASLKRVIWFEDCDHWVHAWLERHDEQRAAVMQAVLAMLTQDQRTNGGQGHGAGNQHPEET